MARIHPDDREAVAQAQARWVTENQAPEALRYRVVVEGAIRHLRATATVQRDGQGKPRYLLGSVVDETQGVEATRRHNELSRRFELALEASRIGIWDWDLSTNELIWDQQMYNLYGIDKNQFEGAYSAWEKGLHPEDKEAVAAALQAAVEKREKFDTKFRVVWPSGEVRVIRAMAQGQLGSNGQSARMIGVNWDITEYQKNKRELERSNRELAQLAYRASHDLKAPLTTIKRLAQYATSDISTGNLERAEKDLALINRQASLLEKLVLGILEIARADVKNTPIHEISFEVLVQEIAESLRAPLEDYGVALSASVLTERRYRLPRVRIYQIMYNLISNSVRYSDPARTHRYVKLEVSERAGRIGLVVADNGLGIPCEFKESIYDMFRTFHSSKISGSGLGLYVVRKHVETLAGTITYQSSRNGTTFTVQLPLETLQ